VVFDGFNIDVIAVVIIENQQVVVALDRREGELVGKITVAFAGGGLINDKQVVNALVIVEGSGKEIRIREQRKSGHLWFSGPLVLPGLLQVSFGCGDRVGSMLAERFQGQTRENFELIGGSQGSLQAGG